MAYSLIADDMAVFARVVEAKGFTAAARVLLVPKVTVSRAVARLERAVGHRLLERTTRRISLTPSGKAVLEHCQQVLLAMEGARAALAGPARDSQLRVGLDSAYGRLLVAPLVPRFLERFPGVALHLVGEEPGFAARRHVADRRASGLGRGGVRARRSRADPVRDAGVSRRARAAAIPQRSRRPRAARQLRWPRPAASTLEGRRRRLDAGLAAGSTRPTPAPCTTPSPPGLGIAVLPEFLCRNGLAMKRLVRLLPDWAVLDGPTLTAVSPVERARSPEVRSFVEFLSANLVPALANKEAGA